MWRKQVFRLKDNFILQILLQRLAERSSELTGIALRACSISLLPGRTNPNCDLIQIRYRARLLILRNYGRAIWICEPFYQLTLAIVANGLAVWAVYSRHPLFYLHIKVGDREIEINSELMSGEAGRSVLRLSLFLQVSSVNVFYKFPARRPANGS